MVEISPSAPPSVVPGSFVRISGLTNQVHYNDRTAVVESLCADGKLGLRVVGGALLKVSTDKVSAEEDQNRIKQASFEGCNSCYHYALLFSLHRSFSLAHFRAAS